MFFKFDVTLWHLSRFNMGTGVHGAHQHEVCRVGGLGVDTGDGDEAVLQGLAQRLQHVTAVFRQLVQEQHARQARATIQ